MAQGLGGLQRVSIDTKTLSDFSDRSVIEIPQLRIELFFQTIKVLLPLDLHQEHARPFARDLLGEWGCARWRRLRLERRRHARFLRRFRSTENPGQVLTEQFQGADLTKQGTRHLADRSLEKATNAFLQVFQCDADASFQL